MIETILAKIRQAIYLRIGYLLALNFHKLVLGFHNWNPKMTRVSVLKSQTGELIRNLVRTDNRSFQENAKALMQPNASRIGNILKTG